MSWVRTMAVVGVLALASTAAVAFQEQRQPAAGSQAPAQTQKTAPALTPQDAPLGRSPQGTEIRIPGLGKLGTLPKLDFGMELLYGNDGRPTGEPAAKPDDSDGLAIRGSVRHKF